MSRLGPFEPNTTVLGDAIEVMAQFPDACVDAIVTDPPYGLEFMGKEWDSPLKNLAGLDLESDRPHQRHNVKHWSIRNQKCLRCGHWRWSGTPCKCDNPLFTKREIGMEVYQQWTTAWAAEAYRILKPGAYMLVMGGTRTHHRLGCGLEDAGFEIRNEIAWVYASGFPKSHNISKAIDKKAGAEREVVGVKPGHEEFANRETDGHILAFKGTLGGPGGFDRPWMEDDEKRERYHHKTAPATPEAQYWEGYGTSLKPAHEPVWLCKKPNEGTYVDNVLKHGCGAMNIDATRTPLIGIEEHKTGGTSHLGDNVYGQYDNVEKLTGDGPIRYSKKGRWPANVLVDCWPEEFIGGSVVLEKEIRLHGPPKEGLRGPEITWERTGESEGDRELWTFTEEYFDDEEMDEEGGCTVYPYTQFVWLRKTMDAVVIEGEAQLHHGGLIRAKTSIGDGNIYQGGGPGFRREPDESSKGDGLLGAYTRFFVIPKPSKSEKNKGCMELYWRREKGGGHTQIGREEWEKLVAEEKRIYEETGKRPRLQARGNIHVTVKPVRLMKWLIRLVTPHQHPTVVVDPFCGSGTTMVAGSQLNWEEEYQTEFYGIDKGENNITIANARLEEEKGAAKQLKLV